MAGYYVPETLESARKEKPIAPQFTASLNVKAQDYRSLLSDSLTKETQAALESVAERLESAHAELASVSEDASNLRKATLRTPAEEIVTSVDLLRLRRITATQAIGLVYEESVDLLKKVMSEYNAAATEQQVVFEKEVDKAVKALKKAKFITPYQLNGGTSPEKIDQVLRATALGMEGPQGAQAVTNALKSRSGLAKNLLSRMNSESHLPSVELSRITIEILRGV